MSNRWSYLLAVVILLLAAGLRMWQITTLPAGLNSDELASVRVMQAIQDGEITVFYDVDEAGEGHEGLYESVMALTTLLIGSGSLGLRLVPIWAAMITLALTYALGVRLFGRIAGLSAMTLLALLMLDILKSRLFLPVSIVPLLITATLMALAYALPVYREVRQTGATNTLAFAALGIVPAILLYVHPVSLLLILVCMIFIVYILFFHRHLLAGNLSYTGFTLLILMILSVPYLTSTINRPELAATGRIFDFNSQLILSVYQTITGIVFVGDQSMLYNLPDRPLIDLVSGLLVLMGLLVVIRYWRIPRFALVLIATVLLLPAVILAQEPPDFLRMVVILPPLVLLFGLGVQTLLVNLPYATRIIGIVAILLLFGFNLIWVTQDLFFRWQVREDVRTAYHATQGLLAHYLDETIDDLPTVVCDVNLNDPVDEDTLTPLRLVQFLMNRDPSSVRYVDCRTGLLFTDGGQREQFILPDPDTWELIHAHLADWLLAGEPVQTDMVPAGTAIVMDVSSLLADRVGQFTTRSAARYPDRINGEVFIVYPEVRFGENVTWLGYDPVSNPIYSTGETLTAINYWRAEGPVPPELNIFIHILSDPVTIAVQRDLISLDASRLEDRDVFIQVTPIDLPETMLPGEYTISVVLEERPDSRLTVLPNDVAINPDFQIDRLFLYPVTVSPPMPDETEPTETTGD